MTSTGRARGRLAGWLLAATLLSGCAQIVQYTDELVDRRSGRSPFVTVPAAAGGFVGFVAGIPFDLLALPITWSVYRVQKASEPERADPLSTMLFPSFVMWRAGTLLAVPFDGLEYLAYRVWRPRQTLTAEERRARELELDEETLPRYPVVPIYPAPREQPEARRSRR